VSEVIKIASIAAFYGLEQPGREVAESETAVYASENVSLLKINIF